MTEVQQIYARLMAPFADEKSRQGSGGRSYSYVTARQVMNRLDDVLGPDKWWDRYDVSADGAVCYLSIEMPDGSVVTKADGGGHADMEDDDNQFKSMMSDAFKRAAAKHGPGRYLYRDGVPAFAGASFEGYHGSQGNSTPQNGYSGGGTGGNGATGQRGGFDGPQKYNCPKNGKALFAWMKDRQGEFGHEVLSLVNNHPEIKGIFPDYMTQWDERQVAFGYAVMKRAWAEAGKWPAGAGNSPGEVNGPTTVRETVAATEASPDEIKAIKGKLRTTFEALYAREKPGEKLKFPDLMTRINGIASAHGFSIPDMMAYRDVPRMRLILSSAEAALHGGAGAVDPDDIPF